MNRAICTQEELEAMKNVDVRTVNPATLRDIRDVKINTALPKEQRIQDYIRQIGNPYCYRHVCGENQFCRYRCDPGGPAGGLHTVKDMRMKNFAKSLDKAGNLC